MQENDRQMLLEYWITRMLQGQSLPLSYVRSPANGEALVAFLLPVAESMIAEADCQVTFDSGPPCLVQFEFIREKQVNSVRVNMEETSDCHAAEIQTAIETVDRFWLFVSQEGNQGINLYEVPWQPVIE